MEDGDENNGGINLGGAAQNDNENTDATQDNDIQGLECSHHDHYNQYGNIPEPLQYPPYCPTNYNPVYAMDISQYTSPFLQALGELRQNNAQWSPDYINNWISKFELQES